MPTDGQVRAGIGTGGFPARWNRACGHKTVGSLYLVLAVLAGLAGGGLALLLQVGQAGLDGAASAPWHRMTIDHGALMILFCALPALTGGFGSWFVPLLLGAPDMAFRRLNLLCWAGLAVSFALVLSGMATAPGMLLWCAAMLGLSIDMVATVLNMRRPGMALRDMPLFAWAQALTGMMMVIVLPVLAASLTRGLLAGTGGRQAELALRAFSGPEIGLLLLPAAGIVCQVVETFSGVALRLRGAALGAMVVLSVGGATIWVHDLFADGLAVQSVVRPLIEQATIAVPMLVLLAAWGATVLGGRAAFRVPMLWACAFAVLLVAGPVLALLGGPAAGHAVALPAALFATFAGFYYWIGKMTGRACPERAGRLHVALAVGGSILLLAPHQPAFVSTGVVLLGLSMLAFVAAIALTLAGRTRPLAANYWGPGARTLEWTVPSPAPRDSFAGILAHGARA
ncbi:Cytochrome-c oxidase [Gluconacetobacter diazotrophicus PA1 5]|uniref:Cytochrome-c oxidase n=2 Tax=Gluconacetobacter diazotrophicus TaxID=33996 RepID=A0A7W4FCB0_GLUDI|nr:cbb3-type cytochrome c oxidase subunit I [Gluconacetobacter diazotrophicus]ACI50116.1 Cytochrome-c oxidase [Gluconacetobacter diazotrophicus PA1 5]MBB2154964.1 cytochrome-c oxidase [Gluconacetobacter diazotrophicus]TWB08125.1 cytochrome c oxidase subunit 1 [Gluconacetobacter diazotrophicus]